jgi:hypothetical protein
MKATAEKLEACLWVIRCLRVLPNRQLTTSVELAELPNNPLVPYSRSAIDVPHVALGFVDSGM